VRGGVRLRGIPARARRCRDGAPGLDHGPDAWRGGESADALFRRSPPIHVVDHDWRGGQRLEGYEIKGDGEPSGHQLHCKVLLTFSGTNNKPVRRTASYTVSTEPTLSIVREDE
jgi:hypothetical protein